MSAGVAIALAAMVMGNPKELGEVRWSRDFDAALAEARRADKPVLILFDEVPGCSTCTGYGETVLSHPLVVEAAESLFVPVAIYNNQGGKDGEVLASFNEPTWNNPVVRIVDADRRPLAPRVNGEYTAAGLVHAMVVALDAAKKPVPEYLRAFASDLTPASQRAVLGMYCFWEGEVCLGAIDGVIATRAGFLDGSEVVEVELDPGKLSYRALIEAAAAKKCMSRVFARSDAEEQAARAAGVQVTRTEQYVKASANDDKYQLAHTPWRYVPMTRAQATKANAMLGTGADPTPLFSMKQRALYERAKLPGHGLADARAKAL